jgi:hypothetical protein
MWNTNDELVGQRILIGRSGVSQRTARATSRSFNCGYDEEEVTVLAVSTTTANIKVLTDDGDIMVGNQWEEV